MSKIECKEETLDNGLKLIGEINPANKSCAIGFFVKTGARDEGAQEAGVSHFLEHMMFKGTKKRNALDITYALGNIGAQANAFTSEENTVYYAGVLPDYFPAMQELLSDMLRPALMEDDFDVEKKVILEEIALYQDRPQFYFFEHAMQDFFAEHSAGNSVLGTTDSISELDVFQMRDYFDRRYVPSNITLVASGNFNWNNFVSDARDFCADWPDFEAERELAPFNMAAVKKEYKKENITQSHILFMTKGASNEEAERYPLALLGSIIGSSTGSRMYWELVDKGLVDSAGAENDEKDGVGCFAAYASTKPERLEQVSDIIRQILSSPLEFSDDDLERAKTKAISSMVLGGELPMGRLMALGTHWNSRKVIHSLLEEIEQIKKVKKDDVAQALEKYPFDKWSEFKLVAA